MGTWLLSPELGACLEPGAHLTVGLCRLGGRIRERRSKSRGTGSASEAELLDSGRCQAIVRSARLITSQVRPSIPELSRAWMPRPSEWPPSRRAMPVAPIPDEIRAKRCTEARWRVAPILLGIGATSMARRDGADSDGVGDVPGPIWSGLEWKAYIRVRMRSVNKRSSSMSPDVEHLLF